MIRIRIRMEVVLLFFELFVDARKSIILQGVHEGVDVAVFSFVDLHAVLLDEFVFPVQTTLAHRGLAMDWMRSERV